MQLELTVEVEARLRAESELPGMTPARLSVQLIPRHVLESAEPGLKDRSHRATFDRQLLTAAQASGITVL